MTDPLPVFQTPPVFLSASVPLIDRHPRFFNTADPIAIRDAVIDLATAVLPVTGIVFGGHPAITPLISAVAARLDHTVGKVVLFQSAFFVKTAPVIRGILHTEVTPVVNNSRDDSLDEMRSKMLTSYLFDYGVFIGGMEGVIDEFDLFRQVRGDQAVALPIATTGAAARIIYDTKPAPPGGWPAGLDDDLAYLSLFRRLMKL